MKDENATKYRKCWFKVYPRNQKYSPRLSCCFDTDYHIHKNDHALAVVAVVVDSAVVL